MIYANVGRDGVIVFEPRADPTLSRLPVARCDNDRKAKRFKEIVGANARLAYDNETLLVPGVPEAENDDKAMDALLAFRSRLDMALVRAGISL